jgi:hypothetical protein
MKSKTRSIIAKKSHQKIQTMIDKKSSDVKNTISELLLLKALQENL